MIAPPLLYSNPFDNTCLRHARILTVFRNCGYSGFGRLLFDGA